MQMPKKKSECLRQETEEGVRMTNEELLKQVDLSKPDFSARSSEVFGLGEDKVLKLYFSQIDQESIDREEKNTTIAYDTGCTPMECYGQVTVEGRKGIVLRRLKGISLTNMPGKDPLIVFRAGKILADLHAMVHEKTSKDLPDIRLVTAALLEDDEIFSFLSASQRDGLKDYIMALPEEDHILHMDFHTDNILCDGTNYQVIDWMTAVRGNPLAEVAMMNFLHHDAELFPGSSKIKIALMNLVRTKIYDSFIKNYEQLTGRTEADSHAWDVVAWVMRLGKWNSASEREELRQKITGFMKGAGMS